MRLAGWKTRDMLGRYGSVTADGGARRAPSSIPRRSPVSKKDRRRAILDVAESNVRLMRATESKASTIKLVRSAEAGDGRILGEVINSSKVILWVSYIAQRGELSRSGPS